MGYRYSSYCTEKGDCTSLYGRSCVRRLLNISLYLSLCLLHSGVRAGELCRSRQSHSSCSMAIMPLPVVVLLTSCAPALQTVRMRIGGMLMLQEPAGWPVVLARWGDCQAECSSAYPLPYGATPLCPGRAGGGGMDAKATNRAAAMVVSVAICFMSELAVLPEAVTIGIVAACLGGVAIVSEVGPFALLCASVVAVQEVSRAVECLGAHVMEPRAPVPEPVVPVVLGAKAYGMVVAPFLHQKGSSHCRQPLNQMRIETYYSQRCSPGQCQFRSRHMF